MNMMFGYKHGGLAAHDSFQVHTTPIRKMEVPNPGEVCTFLEPTGDGSGTLRLSTVRVVSVFPASQDVRVVIGNVLKVHVWHPDAPELGRDLPPPREEKGFDLRDRQL